MKPLQHAEYFANMIFDNKLDDWQKVSNDNLDLCGKFFANDLKPLQCAEYSMNMIFENKLDNW